MNTQKNPAHGKKSHYMNPTLTYWSFLKNRPTIQPNTQKRRIGKGHHPTARRQMRQQKKPETTPNHA